MIKSNQRSITVMKLNPPFRLWRDRAKYGWKARGLLSANISTLVSLLCALYSRKQPRFTYICLLRMRSNTQCICKCRGRGSAIPKRRKKTVEKNRTITSLHVPIRRCSTIQSHCCLLFTIVYFMEIARIPHGSFWKGSSQWMIFLIFNSIPIYNLELINFDMKKLSKGESTRKVRHLIFVKTLLWIVRRLRDYDRNSLFNAIRLNKGRET